MIEAHGSVDIARPRQDVFAFMTDLDHLPEWLEGVRDARPLSPDPTAVGSKVCHTNEFMGRTFESIFEVLEWEDNRLTVFKVLSGPLRGESRQTFAALGDAATRVSIDVVGDGTGALKLGNFVAQRTAQRRVDRSLATVKDLLEDPGARR